MRLFLTLLVASAVAFSGCGGDDDSGSSTEADAGAATTQTQPSTSTETTPAETTETDAQGSGGSGSDDSGGGGDQSGGSSGSDDSGGADSGGSSGGTSAGGSSGDQQAASTAVTSFYAALSSGDGDKACALMGDAVKEQFTKALAKAQNKQGASCEELAGTVAKSYPDVLRQRLSKLTVTKVTVNGDKATVMAKLPGAAAQKLPLVRDGDSWKIQAPIGAGTSSG